MLNNFHLAAIVKQDGGIRLLHLPLHQELQQTLSDTWSHQYVAFMNGKTEVDFNAGYQPEEHEQFSLANFELPGLLLGQNSQTIETLDAVTDNDALLSSSKGIVGFARDEIGAEIILFQNFSRSHVIQPGRFLFLNNDTYETTSRPALALDSKLSAAYFPATQKLLFHNFRTVNTFLPLADYYKEASEHEIKEVLNHESLAPEDADVLATDANQWFRKRFAMLRDSGVLNEYSPKQIQVRSKGYDVEIHISKGKIVFPADKPAAKKLLQFLNEELFRGAITDKLFETNSKREADA